jgi:hypothetical protein
MPIVERTEIQNRRKTMSQGKCSQEQWKGRESRSAARGVLLCTGLLAATATAQRPEPTWMLRSLAGPSARCYAAMCYDSCRHVTVLFSGYGPGTADTWEWDGTTWTLKATTGPSTRWGAAMAFDSRRYVTVLFGGGGGLSDTWEWDGTSWTQRFPVHSPSARQNLGMAYDSARGVAVLFGGWNGSALGDTWLWDGDDWSPGSTGPSPRYEYGMAYDSARERTVLFGGCSAPGTPIGQTWEWDGQAWHQMTPPGQEPSKRFDDYMAYDAARGVTVLFGGYLGGSNTTAETWEWNGSWTQQYPTIYPSARDGHALAYDSARRVVVLFGGQLHENGQGILGDTWEYGVPGPGDMNCDGALDGADIDPFFLALGDPAAWQAAFPGCTLINGDINNDGEVDGFDIEPFFKLLEG